MKRIPIEVSEGVELPKTEKILSFTEWLKENRSIIAMESQCMIFDPKILNEIVDDYHDYLRDLPKEKASVIEKVVVYDDNDFIGIKREDSEILRVLYNGRCSIDGDLFTIYYPKVIYHAQGTLNGLFIEIPE